MIPTDPEVQAFIFMGIVGLAGLILFLLTPLVLLGLAIRWRSEQSIERKTEKEKKTHLQREQGITFFLSIVFFGWFLVLYPFLFGLWHGEFDIIDYLLFFSHLIFGFFLIRSIIFRSKKFWK